MGLGHLSMYAKTLISIKEPKVCPLDSFPHRKNRAGPPPSPCFSAASCTDCLLGGGPPIVAATTGAILRARAPPEDAGTIAKVHPGRLTIVRLPPSISIVVGEKTVPPCCLVRVGRSGFVFGALDIELGLL
jgi:hypothetical protein